MASAMRKMGIYLGLVEDDEDRLGHDQFDDDDEVEPPTRMADRAPTRSFDRSGERGSALTRGGLALDTRARASTDNAQSVSAYRITTLHPRTYNEARTIGEHFREGVPVIMNLTEMDDSDAKRLVDFAAGLSFGLRGRIERVTNKVFLLSPANVEVTAEDKARIAEGGFFNQS
ncbi:MAG: cell division protein SepF [Jatrophihabitantaceae bacterium]